MRPGVLEHGYGMGARVLFKVIRALSGHPVPDAARITFYRPDFYGRFTKQLTHRAMRGPSTWSVAERELMAAYVSRVNASRFCVGAHTATATQAFGDAERVLAVLADVDSAPIHTGLRATLRLLEKLSTTGTLDAQEVRGLLSAGVTRQQVADALAVNFAFNVTDRLANAFAFEILSDEGFDAGARYLLKRGYK